MTGAIHTYHCSTRWEGSTGQGYDAYDRTHTAVTLPAGVTVALASDPAFRGDPSLLNPEQLIVLAASSCQLLSFLTVAARARIDVVAYEDAASAVMPEEDLPVRITRIELQPVITVVSGTDGRPSDDRLVHLCEVAHRECYVANSLRTEIIVTPTFLRRKGHSTEV